MSKVKLYYDLMSQPSRTLAIFLNVTKIPTEHHQIQIGKGEHTSPEFLKLNPLHAVPVIDDNGFVLRESVAIARYLCRERNVPDHWYPKESKKQARCDEYLEWQHLGTRAACAYYFRLLFLDPFFSGQIPADDRVAHVKKLMIKTVDTFDKVWLGDKKFLCGDEISIADIFAATELEQPRMCGYDPRDGRPKLAAWMERVREATNPHYDDAHKVVNKLVEKYKGESPIIANLKKKQSKL